MITWGISAGNHNAALAVFKNRDLVFASEAERFSKFKNDPDLNNDLIECALGYGEPEKIFWYEKPWPKTMRQIYAGQGFQNNSVTQYLKKYNIHKPVHCLAHHHSHAAAGYYTSKFEEACVLVIDAIGEFECYTQWLGQGRRLDKVRSLDYPHSLGLFYSAMTQRCGLKPNEEEYILMGMAALGDPDRLFKDMFREFISLPNDDYGDPYRLKQNLHRGCLAWRPDLVTEQDRYDIAAAAQQIYETVFERILQMAANSSRNLVLMGGCALNCSANPLAYKYFDNVWIMPAPGDNGSAIGAVLADMSRHIEWAGPYLGFDMGYSSCNDEIVDYLIENKVCGLARGRAEFGPRALGNRSLIADPRDPEIKVLINNIKHREQFRPFAPAILEEFADQYFKMPTKSTPYMQHIAVCKESDRFPGIVHVDNTSRVQTVNRTDNPSFRDLLEKWFVRTGCPMLLNTSLNIKGEPMINDHRDRLRWQEKHGLPVFN
jgi:carbamoyltransferase